RFRTVLLGTRRSQGWSHLLRPRTVESLRAPPHHEHSGHGARRYPAWTTGNSPSSPPPHALQRATSNTRTCEFNNSNPRFVPGNSSNNVGHATSTARACAREIATLNRFGLNRNSRPRGASSCEDTAIE